MRKNKQEEKQAKELAEFLSWVGERDIVEFAGVAQLLGVRLVENIEDRDEKVEGARSKMRPFDQIIENMIDTYLDMNRDQRRAIKKLMREIRKEEFLYGRN